MTMKTHFCPLPLLALCPALALAQPKAAPTKTAPQISIDPAAQALMDKATATYKMARGIRFEVEGSTDGKVTSQNSVTFARPNSLQLEIKDFPDQQKVVGDGSYFYLVRGTSYRKFPAVKGWAEYFLSLHPAGQCATIIGQMLTGKNFLADFRQQMSESDIQSAKISFSLLPSQVVDGGVASGVQLDMAIRTSSEDTMSYLDTSQIILWFGADSTLRRLTNTYKSTRNGVPIVLKERVFNQKLNPTFAPDTFKFDSTGITLDDQLPLEGRNRFGSESRPPAKAH